MSRCSSCGAPTAVVIQDVGSFCVKHFLLHNTILNARSVRKGQQRQVRAVGEAWEEVPILQEGYDPEAGGPASHAPGESDQEFPG